MYCGNCGKEVHAQAVACPSCGVPPRVENKFCNQCANPLQPNQVICKKCGTSVQASLGNGGEKQKIVAGLLAIFLGWIGIHKFYLG